MQYDFDRIIDRQGTNSMSVEGYRDYLFAGEVGLQIDYPKEEIIRMWVADMEFATAPEIVEALQKRLEHGIFGYSKVFDPQYAEAFLAWTESRYGWKWNPDHLLNSPGIIPVLFEAVKNLCKPGEKVLILTPSYAFFKHAADYQGRELVTSDLILEGGHYSIDFEDLRQKAADEAVKLSILCNPHNPTGRAWTEAELRQFGEICLENEVAIVSDEIHCDILRQGQQFIPLAKLFPESDQIITCMSPSKTFNLAGFLFANIIIPDDALRAKWQEKVLILDNPLSITAAQAAYTHGKPWLEELTAYLDQNFEFLRDYLKEHLPQAIFKIPQATYLAWVDVSAYFPPGENLTLFFANQAGVVLEGGNMFVANADGFIRLNLACPRSLLKKGLERIKGAILSRGRG
jgi:cystathionine beta-lyase